jgi:hypothetical protein
MSASADDQEFFEPPELKDFTVEEIRRICMQVRLARASRREATSAEAMLELMRSKYPDFWFRYPKLLDMCCQPTMDMAHLEYMLGLLSHVQTSQTTMLTANKEVQTRLAETFLPPEMLAKTQEEAKEAQAQEGGRE